MGRHVMDLDVILARWVLGEIFPEDVPALAADAVVDGCVASSVAVLAGLSRPTRSEIDDELPALLRELGVSQPSEREAVKIVADSLTRQIVAGKVTAGAGGAELASYAQTFFNDDAIWEQLAVFYGLALERDEQNRPALEIDAEVIAEASSLIASGGLQTE